MTKHITTVTVICLSLGGCLTTKTGEKVGQIVKLSQEGIFCPTYEAEIVRGGFNAGSGTNGQSFKFTIETKELANKVQSLMEARKEVKLTYHEELNTLCRSNSDDNFLDSIVELEPSR